jgi:hypothetical protein
MKFRSVQKRTQIWPDFVLLFISLDYNRGVSVVRLKLFKIILEVIKESC